MSPADKEPEDSTPTPAGRQTGSLRVAVLLVAVAAVAALGLALRDLPRRWVERLLAERLAAEVDLGSFSIRGLDSFELGRLHVREPAIWPEIRTVRVDGMSVETGLRSALAGSYRELTFDGLEVVLAPVAGDAPRPQGPAPTVEADLVDVRRAKLVLDDGDRRLVCDLAAVLEGLGQSLEGRLRIRCPRLGSAPLLAVLESRAAGQGAPSGPAAALRSAGAALDLEGFAADLLLGRRPGGMAGRASAARCRLSVNGSQTDLGPLTARLVDEPGGARLTAEIGPSTVADAVRLEAWLDGDSWQWRRAAGNVRRLRLEAASAWLPPRYSDWTAEGVADLDLTAEPRTGASLAAAVTLLRLARSGVEQPLRRAELRIEAEAAPEGSEPRATVRARAGVPAGADRGSARPLPAGLLPLAAEVAGEWSETGDRFTASRLTLETGRLGRLTAAGSVLHPSTAAELLADWRWSGAPLTDLLAAAGVADEDPLAGAALRGSVSGSGRLEGALSSLLASGALRFDGLEVAADPTAGAEAAAAAVSAWSLLAQPFEIAWARAGAGTPVHLSLEDLTATLGLAGLQDLELGVSGRGRLAPALDAVEVEALELRAAELGRGALSGRLSPTADADLRLRWAGADLPAWLAYLAPEWKGPWEDLSLRGKADADLELARAPSGLWRSCGALTLVGGGFEAAGGARVLDGLHADVGLDATLTADGSAEARSRIRAGGFQLLWGTVFADYSTTRVDLDFATRGRREPGGAEWTWNASARSLLSGATTLAAEISLEPGKAPRMGVDLEIGELGGFLTDYVQTPLASSGPLGGLRAAGELTVSVSASLEEVTRSVAGRIVARGLDCRTESGGFEVREFDLDLPADLVWRRDETTGAATVEGPPLEGRFRFAETSAGGVFIDETSTTFLVEGDSATLESSLTVPLLGGRIHLDHLTVAELLRPGRGLAAALRLEGVQLSEVSRAFDLFPLEGEASGEFPRVRLVGDALRVDGGGRISVFGGEVTVKDISGSRIFSDYPRLELSADFREIDLERLTSRLDFGEITGRVEGHVSDLELFRGTPVRFRARLASVRRRGQRQALSLKAIDNIALLGGGGGVGALNRGVQRFFDSYRYRELGLAMVLDNDHFLLRGLTRRGQDELFIKGRPPVRLDMVNVKPGRTVSFRTMMERLRNLEVTRKVPGSQDPREPPAGAELR